MLKVLTLGTLALGAGATNKSSTSDDAAFLAPSMRESILPTPETFVSMTDLKLARAKSGAKEVKVKGAQWLRVAFDKDSLSESFNIEIKSKYDGHVQKLNSTSMKQWSYVSAYFNGDAVEVTTIRGDEPSVAGAIGNIGVTIGGEATTISTISRTICGPTDDREASGAARTARYLTGTGICTGWLIRDENNCFLTAGHCGSTNGQSGGTMQFNVPLSNPDGSTNNPGPEDQYVVDPDSVQLENAGVGADWMYLGTFPNSNTGLTAYEAQADAYELTTVVPAEGDYTQKYGYGSTSPRDQYYAVQQFHGLPDSYIDQGRPKDADTARYTIDTTGGDSGSAVESSEGIAFAVHTHGGCPNAGTLLHRASLQAALANPLGVCKPGYKREN